MLSGRALRGLSLVVALSVFIAACAAVQSTVCPRVAFLGQASTLTKLAPGGSSPADVVVEAVMSDIKLDCVFRGEQLVALETNFSFVVAARRGPAMRGDSVEVEYFIVITDRAGAVLNKRVFPLRLDFGGREVLRIRETTWQQYRLETGATGSSFEIWAGFQLSDAELKFNRERQAR